MIIKKWEYGQTYNFSDEFNRIEGYNQYCDNWITDYYYWQFKRTQKLQHKTEWEYTNIPFLDDYNRIKRNMNDINKQLKGIQKLEISEEYNQKFNNNKANELEKTLEENINNLGNLQVSHGITGLSLCGSNYIRLGGAN